MNSNLLIPAAVLVVIVAAAFVVGRLRVGDLRTRRDAPVLAAIAIMGLVALLALLAPPPVARVGIPTTLALAGLYLLANRATIEAQPKPRRTLLLIAAAGAVVLGLFGLLVAVLR